MNDDKLLRNLRSVGMACYVAYHDKFADFSFPKDMLVPLLVEMAGYIPTASTTRVVKSREIIRAGRDRDALKMISQALRVAPAIAEGARKLLKGSTTPNRRDSLQASILPGSKSDEGRERLIKTTDDRTPNIIHSSSVSELLALHASTLDELRRRRIVRSANGPGGDYAEFLCVRAFGWKLAGKSCSGYDAIDRNNFKYQVKSRRIINVKTPRQLSALRNMDRMPFDFVAGILFNADYSVMRAAIVPHQLIRQRARFNEHTNSSIFYLNDSVWSLPDVRDITAELRTAAVQLNQNI